MADPTFDEVTRTEQVHKDSIDTSSFFPDNETADNATNTNTEHNPTTSTPASLPAHLNPANYPQTLTNESQTVHIELTYLPLSTPAATKFTRSPTAGATVLFLGTTRSYFQDPSRPVSRLSYSTYPALALRTLMRIATTTQASHALEKIYVAHRLGEVAVEEESIVVAVSSAHRGAGWAGAEELLEQVKAKAEIWKREWFVDGVVEEGRDGQPGREVGVWRDNRDSDRMGVRTER